MLSIEAEDLSRSKYNGTELQTDQNLFCYYTWMLFIGCIKQRAQVSLSIRNTRSKVLHNLIVFYSYN